MKRLFLRRSPKFVEMIDNYLQKASECLEIFQKALFVHVEKKDMQLFRQLVDEVDQAESAADTLRREIELTLYEKALIPESRGDILGILEAVDKIPIFGALIGGLAYVILGRILYILNPHFLAYDKLMRILLIAGGCYGAYAIGANNVANVTGVFYKSELLTMFQVKNLELIF